MVKSIYLKRSLEIKTTVSNEIIKYVYKADCFQEFQRRTFLLSKLIGNKILQELRNNA